MSRHWKEKLDPSRHRDYMNVQIGGLPIEPSKDRLIDQWVYFVNVASFTFQFASVEQIKTCLDYFKQKTHPTSLQPEITLEHYWQRWFERLPQWLFEESKRAKVISALEKAVAEFEN